MVGRALAFRSARDCRLECRIPCGDRLRGRAPFSPVSPGQAGGLDCATRLRASSRHHLGAPAMSLRAMLRGCEEIAEPSILVILNDGRWVGGSEGSSEMLKSNLFASAS